MKNSRIAFMSFLATIIQPVAGNVPTGTLFPYIHLNYVEGDFAQPVLQSAILYSQDMSGKETETLTEQISEAIGTGGQKLCFDGGYVTVFKGNPFAQPYSLPIEDNLFANYINFELRTYKI